MNQYLEKLIELGVVVAGKISKEDGFIIFEREDDPKKIKKINGNELAFATTGMGRAIFQVAPDGKIINYKGVDSHLDNTELNSTSLVSADAIYLSNPDKSYKDSKYPLNLVFYPDKKADIRIRGASPLEDLEIEAFINSKMQGNGIKLPQVNYVREFSEQFALKHGLPIKIDGDFKDFDSDYKQEDSERKEYLKQIYGENYQEIILSGKRPETFGEYFRRIEILESPEFIQFAQKRDKTVEDIIKDVDTFYSLGQRYGQTERIIENPFRISDIEYYTKQGNTKALNNIINFSESIQSTQEPMENYFAKHMGINLANMLNSGWMCNNYEHRQDYTLAGEMCDDSYDYLPDRLIYNERKIQSEMLKELEKVEIEESDNIKEKFEGKLQATQHFDKKRYFYQIFMLGSTIKVLQDEMKLRGKGTFEIDSVMNDFVSSFLNTLDFEKVSSFTGVDAKKAIEALVKVPQDYEKILSQKIKKSEQKESEIDESIANCLSGTNDFFDKMCFKVAYKLGIKREQPQTETKNESQKSNQKNLPTDGYPEGPED